MKSLATITLVIAAIATGVLIAAWQLGFLGPSDRESGSEAIPNVRLGMAPRDVRDRFQPNAGGSWQTALGVGDDTVLEWTARGDHESKSSSVLEARFEFHLGMLVAIRARTNDAIAKEQVTATAKTVTIRSPVRAGEGNGATSIIVLARDCPTHKDEAESFASKAH